MISLKSLNAELRPTEFGKEKVDSIWMDCPLCKGTKEEHWIVIPYRKEGGRLLCGQLAWTHVSGSTLDDLTLSPSYRIIGRCNLHGFVKAGFWKGC